MGLDQYAYVVKPNPLNTDFSYEEFDEDGNEADALITEWRKHPNLEGWMESLFNKKADAQRYLGNTKFSSEVSITAVDKVDNPSEELMSQSLSEDAMKEKIKEAKDMSNIINMTKRRVFNCQPIRLTTGDLDQLEMHVKNSTLPNTEGFFFGDDADDHYKANDLEFIRRARLAINAGLEVYYRSWW
jgi:hypothetical protein